MTRPPTSYPVLLHGFTGAASSWEGRLVDALAGAGCPPVLVDLPGHGADAGASDAMAFTLEAALARIEAAGRWPADLIGYSMGGRLALHFAAAHPDRVHRLVLESSSPGLDSERERSERQESDRKLAARIETEGIEWFVDHWEARPTFAGQARLDPDTRQRQRSLRLGNDPRSLAAALRGLGTGALPSLWDTLPRIGQPTLLVVGELDGKFVGISERMAASMPHASVAVIPGVGHNVHLEAPAAWLAAVLGFLASGIS